MRPTLKRTIITSKTTGQRYYLGRSGNRTNSRRYYVCSKPDCDERLTRESDLFCRVHSQSNKLEDVDEDILNENSEIIDEEIPIEAPTTTDNDDQQNESILNEDLDHSIPLSSRKRAKTSRQVHVDETTGKRTFRDESGRLRHLCMNPSCTNMLKRQTDIFCGTHTITTEKKKKSVDHKRHSAPPISEQIKNRFRSPFSPSLSPTTTAVENGTNGNHSEEYESPQKSPEPTGTNRSFRDASGKIRFLCFNPSCNSRLIRRSDTFCKRYLKFFFYEKLCSIRYLDINLVLNSKILIIMYN
jgi:hypothetical protein